jgi:hypothetical protein
LFESDTQSVALDKATDIIAEGLSILELEVPISHLAREQDNTCAPNFREILLKCPFGLSWIADGHGPLEYVRGLEVIRMFLLAKQRGRLCGYKEVWSRRPVTSAVPEQVLQSSECRATITSRMPFKISRLIIRH